MAHDNSAGGEEMSKKALVFSMLAFAFCLPVNAESVQLLSQNRFVRARDQDIPPADGFGLYDASDTFVYDGYDHWPYEVDITAFQTSEFEGDVWTGSGGILVEGIPSDVEFLTFFADSYISVDFEVLETTNAHLNVYAEFNSASGIYSEVYILDITDTPQWVIGTDDDPNGFLDTDVTLTPGTYQFVAYTTAPQMDYYFGALPFLSNYDFTFTVPAPSSALLLGAGILLPRRKRRSRN